MFFAHAGTSFFGCLFTGLIASAALVRCFFSRWSDWHKLFRRPGGLQATLGLLPVSADAAHLAEGLSTAGAAVGLLLGVDGTVPLQVT